MIGGIPEGTVTMVYGPPKTGKSVFAYHFLAESIRKNEACLVVMTEYGANELFLAMSGFGWNIEEALKNGAIQLIDMTSAELERRVEAPSWSLKYVSVTNPTNLMMQTSDTLQWLSQRKLRFRAIFESLTPLFIYNPPMLVAKFLRQFALKMKSTGSIGVVVTYAQGSVDPQSEIILKSSLDNVIHLRDDGKLAVEGMLGTPRTTASYEITRTGMRVSLS